MPIADRAALAWSWPASKHAEFIAPHLEAFNHDAPIDRGEVVEVIERLRAHGGAGHGEWNDPFSVLVIPFVAAGGWERTREVVLREDPEALYRRQVATELLYAEPLPLQSLAQHAEDIERVRRFLQVHFDDLAEHGTTEARFNGWSFLLDHVGRCYPDLDADTRQQAIVLISGALGVVASACRDPKSLSGLGRRVLYHVKSSSRPGLTSELLKHDTGHLAEDNDAFGPSRLRVGGLYGVFLIADFLENEAAAGGSIADALVEMLRRVTAAAGVGDWSSWPLALTEGSFEQSLNVAYLGAVDQPWRDAFDDVLDNYDRLFVRHWSPERNQERLAQLGLDAAAGPRVLAWMERQGQSRGKRRGPKPKPCLLDLTILAQGWEVSNDKRMEIALAEAAELVRNNRYPSKSAVLVACRFNPPRGSNAYKRAEIDPTMAQFLHDLDLALVPYQEEYRHQQHARRRRAAARGSSIEAVADDVAAHERTRVRAARQARDA